MAVLWVVAPCSLVEVHRRFRDACRLYHQDYHLNDGGSMTSETSVNFYRTTLRNDPEHSRISIACSEQPANGLHAQSCQPGHIPTTCLQPTLIFCTIYAYISQVIFCIRGFDNNFVCTSYVSHTHHKYKQTHSTCIYIQKRNSNAS
jgi:hypothetical protein